MRQKKKIAPKIPAKIASVNRPYQSRDKSFIKRIIPGNLVSPALCEQSLSEFGKYNANFNEHVIVNNRILFQGDGDYTGCIKKKVIELQRAIIRELLGV
jgi:hypothetical protein